MGIPELITVDGLSDCYFQSVFGSVWQSCNERVFLALNWSYSNSYSNLSFSFFSQHILHNMEASTSQKNWELENNIITVDPAQDQVYFYDAAQDKENVAQKPWKNE